jgi:cell division septal protein FtsQ
MPVPAPADRRFRRAHVSPGRRRPWHRTWGRRLLAGIALGAAAVVVYAALALAVSSPALAVGTITITGNERISAGEVHALLEGLAGTSILTLDIERWRRQLRASRWVADADIRRVLPGTVAVAITERRAVGIAHLRGELHLVDAAGTIIDEYGPNYADIDLPIVYGLAHGRSGELMVDEARAALLSRLLADVQTRPGLAARISHIDVADVRNASVMLKDDPVRVRLGTERFAERLESYIELAPALHERVLDIDSADLRFGKQVVVSPRPPARRSRDGAERGKG